ncbi:hypothetical protein SCUCBS95973_008606 [Sporothrix curviconia]|uniref:HMG box domain-containing protein n=1 Tax=Sporothrix curviconia TaxID=1260050 RepID=A0ABP0CN00_9PEZI
MTQRLDEVLEELNLSQYYQSFVDQGFDTWETILDITESDLRIANFRGIAPDVALPSPTRTTSEEASSSRPDSVPKLDTANYNLDSRGAVPGVLAKRKYRRHPKPDESAPERPPSAYVLFSNKTREELKGRNLTFTEIAKHVGENWQGLTAAEREPFETQAQLAKEKYNSDLAEYKKTDGYKQYMVYLQEFKAKHSNQAQDKEDASTKRIKLADLSSSMVSRSDGSSASPPPRPQQFHLHHVEHDHQQEHHLSKRPRVSLNDHDSRSGSEGLHDGDAHNNRKHRHGSAVSAISASDYSASPTPTSIDHPLGAANHNNNPASLYCSPHSRPISLSPQTQHETSARPTNRNSKPNMQLSLPSLARMFDSDCQQRSPAAGGPPGSSADANRRPSPGMPPHAITATNSSASNVSAASYFSTGNGNGSSVSSNGGGSHPRTPLDGSMPIHALLSGGTAKPLSPTSPQSSASAHSASMPPHPQPYPHAQYQQQPYPAHATQHSHPGPPPSWTYGHGPSPADRHPAMYKDQGTRPAGPAPYQYRS